MPVVARDELEPVCPAATPIAGPVGRGPSIVCGVIALDRREGTDGVGLTAAGAAAERQSVDGVLLRMDSDPSSIIGFCCGTAVPVLHDGERQRRAHHSYCPVWVAEKERIAAGREQLAEDAQPDPVSMGVGDDHFTTSSRLSDLDLFKSEAA
jgi:hypothetical protein